MRYQEDTLQHTAAELLASEGLPVDALLRLRVVGKSMYPALLPGDCLAVAPADVAQLRRGDVVVAKRSDGFVTHRLISFAQDGYLLKGDRMRYLDQPVAEEDVVGVVKQVDRDGTIYDFSARPLVRLNRFLGWLGLMEVRWWFVRPIAPVLNLFKRWAVYWVSF